MISVNDMKYLGIKEFCPWMIRNLHGSNQGITAVNKGNFKVLARE